MGFIEAIQSGFNRYFDFAGRSCRSEYWFWTLFVVILSIVTGIIDGILFSAMELSPISMATSLALLIPGLAVSVRRLHDINKSGWWLLLVLVPLVGIVVLFIWAIKKGDSGTNNFGGDPLK